MPGPNEKIPDFTDPSQQSIAAEIDHYFGEFNLYFDQPEALTEDSEEADVYKTQLYMSMGAAALSGSAIALSKVATVFNHEVGNNMMTGGVFGVAISLGTAIYAHWRYRRAVS